MKLDFLLSGPFFLIWWRTTACYFKAFCTLRCFSPALFLICWQSENTLLSSLFCRIIEEQLREFSSFQTKEWNFKSIGFWFSLMAIKFLFSVWDRGLFTLRWLSKLDRSKKSLLSYSILMYQNGSRVLDFSIFRGRQFFLTELDCPPDVATFDRLSIGLSMKLQILVDSYLALYLGQLRNSSCDWEGDFFSNFVFSSNG